MDKGGIGSRAKKTLFFRCRERRQRVPATKKGPSLKNMRRALIFLGNSRAFGRALSDQSADQQTDQRAATDEESKSEEFSPFGLWCSSRGKRMGSSNVFGDPNQVLLLSNNLDFHQCVLGQTGYFNTAPGRKRSAEILGIYFVHGRKIVHVA